MYYISNNIIISFRGDICMANIKAAKKKLRQDLKRTASNLSVKKRYRQFLKLVTNKTTAKSLKETTALIDKAAKRRVISQNKAARLKSRINRKGKK